MLFDLLWNVLLFAAFWLLSVSTAGQPVPAGSFGFFFASCVCCGCTLLAETFNRANSSNLGGNWTVISGTWTISGNKLSTSSSNALVVWTGASVPGEQMLSASSMNGSAVGDQVRMIFNYTSAVSYNFLEHTLTDQPTDNTTAKLYEVNGGAPAQLGSTRIMSGVWNTNLFGSTVCVKLLASGKRLLRAAVFPARGIAALTAVPAGTTVGLGTGTVTGTVTFDSATIARTKSAAQPTCFECGSCVNCKDLATPTAMSFAIAGIADGTCNECARMNGTYIVDNFDTIGGSSFCDGNYDLGGYGGAGYPCQGQPPGYFDGFFCYLNVGALKVSFTRYYYYANLICGGLGTFLGFASPDYTTPIDETTNGQGGCFFANLNLPHTGTDSAACDGSGATCHVTAIT